MRRGGGEAGARMRDAERRRREREREKRREFSLLGGEKGKSGRQAREEESAGMARAKERERVRERGGGKKRASYREEGGRAEQRVGRGGVTRGKSPRAIFPHIIIREGLGVSMVTTHHPLSAPSPPHTPCTPFTYMPEDARWHMCTYAPASVCTCAWQLLYVCSR